MKAAKLIPAIFLVVFCVTGQMKALAYDEYEIDEIRKYIQDVYDPAVISRPILELVLNQEIANGTGISWFDTIDYLIKVDKAYTAFRQGGYYEGALTVSKLSLQVGLQETPKLIGLGSAGIIATAAALPIELALNSFVNTVNEDGIQYQIEAYIAAREFLSHEEILAGKDRDSPGVYFIKPGGFSTVCRRYKTQSGKTSA